MDTDNGKSLYLLGVSYDTVNGYTYPKIIQTKNDQYRYYIIPFFPMPFIEFGNVQGMITYSKIKGIENGTKRERTYITTENNIREIISKGKNEIELIIYSKAINGINSFIVQSNNFEKDRQYSVQINYKSNNTSGSFSRSVTTKY